MNHIKEHHIVFALIILAALARGLPHPDNITPIGALALFSGAYLDKRVFWLVPLGALFLGDLANGLYNTIVLIAVYVGFLASTMVGRGVLRHRDRPARIVLGVGLGALTFWVVSNFGSWLVFRPLTVEGFVACYVEGLPYLGRSLVGDGFYALILFGTYHALRTQMTQRWAH
ncbi:MAG: hypothetical protein O7G86_07465 [Gammaproteobacteria bacterium]|nr:hypothetical protein [Gammaproteobacteria bacterium]